MPTPLIDGDVIRYESGFASEVGWQGEGVPPFDYVAEMVDKLINHICNEVGATAPPIIFFTGKTNFRTAIAKRQKYKDRASVKPFHYKNITAYLKGKYEWREREGLEADDLMSIEQMDRDTLHSRAIFTDDGRTIISSRDKDLRTNNGWFFSWELGNQPSFGPDYCDGYGWIELTEKRHPKDTQKIKGRGYKFFLAQCITGDITDTIPGIPKYGPVKAFAIVEPTKSIDEGYKAVLEAYRGLYGDDAEKELKEQAQLLYMVREWNEDGTPKMWEPPNV